MTMVRRREARKAQGLERWSGKEEDATRNPKRIGGKWMSSAIRNLMDEWLFVCTHVHMLGVKKLYVYLLISLTVPI